jgi:hypothetical protein
MERYGNLSRKSGVRAYELGPGLIRVRFADGPVYVYTEESAGAANIAEMKRLASAGKGLSTFITRHVASDYAFKED